MSSVIAKARKPVAKAKRVQSVEAKPTATQAKAGRPKARPKILFAFLDQDTPTGVSLETADKLQRVLKVESRTEVIHLALAKMAQSTLPRYEADDGPVREEVLAEIRRRVPQGRLKKAKSLF
jgi:hypothetical protein